MASLDQPRVGQTLSVNGFDEAVETVQRVNLHIAFVQAKGEFVNVAMQVLRAGMVIDAVHPTASLTQPMKHEPCRLLLYADFFGDLHGRDALAGRDEQVHGIQPLVEWDVRPFEDRASTDREIELALITAMKASLARRDAILTGTSWAGNAFRPETAFEVGSRRLFIWEHLEKLKCADSRTAH